MSILLSPLTIKDVVLRNRIVVPPMCQYSAVEGFANNWHLVHYGCRATGGAGLIIQEATAVSPEGRISPDDLGLWKNEQVEKLKEITTFIHSQGAVAAIQLAHAGRKAGWGSPWKGGKQLKLEEGGWKNVAPSAVAYYPEDDAPVALDMAGIQKVTSDFGSAAARALQAGFRVLEIHAAHGYLVHQFFSPLTNHRNDQYGGSFENRIRLLLEIVEAVKKSWPENLPLFVRISATDWAEGGWNPEESAKLVVILKEMGVDLIDCSSGGLVTTQKIPLSPGYQVHLADKIRKESGILTSAVGLITSAQQAEDILQSGAADLIMFGRLFLREPYFALKAAAELKDEIEWPHQYLRGK
jgi:2,4-dienoyl-CoA reductase-like NADH-dependent reductase (Old Yellow Enzyme family)